MTVTEELHARRRQRPFDPFRVVTKDGRKFDVREWFSFGFNEIMVFGAKDAGGSWRARYGEIAAIEPLKTAN